MAPFSAVIFTAARHKLVVVCRNNYFSGLFYIIDPLEFGLSIVIEMISTNE
jgi:hypothetical protein